MGLIKNFDELAVTTERKVILGLIEVAFDSIQPEKVFSSNIKINGTILKINDDEFDLDLFERVFIIGFGKGAAGNSALLEALVGDKLTGGYVIDTERRDFKKIKFTQGTHPLPSEENFKFTQEVISKLSSLNEKDLVLVVICGGGSAMFVHPHSLSLEQKINVGKAILKSGATISEMNAVRKHLSDVKGGGLARILYPGTIATLIFSDVPGNDLSVIASGPTVKDPTTIDDALTIIKKYSLEKILNLPREAFVETPQDDKYFENVKNNIVLSNITALEAMKARAHELGWAVDIFSDHFESEAKEAGQKLIDAAHENSILLIGGETTVKVNNKDGIGGRNQELVLGSLDYVHDDITIASFDSDGWDNTEIAGAIGDLKTVEHAEEKGLNAKLFLGNNNSLEFFKKSGDAIVTGRLPSNVSDLMIVLRK